MQKVSVCNVNLQLIESKEHSFLMSSRDVSEGYGVSEAVIRSHKKNQADELIEGKHFVMIRTANNATKTMWTKRGIVRLGFFIKSERAKQFRDWAEDYAIDGQNADNDLKQIIMRQNETIAQLSLELDDAKKMIGHNTDGIPTEASWFLLDMVGSISAYIDESEHIEILQQKRRESMEKFMRAFVKVMKNEGLIEQSLRKSGNINHQSINAQK